MSEPHAITLPQPRAWAVATGRQRCVSLTIWTRYRGPIAIYAAPRKVTGDVTKREREQWCAAGPIPHADELAYSSLVGVARLAAIVRPDQARNIVADAPGPWVWLIEDARPIRPIPCAVRYSLWPVPGELLDDIDAAIRNRPAPPPRIQPPREHQANLFGLGAIPPAPPRPRKLEPIVTPVLAEPKPGQHVAVTNAEVPF